jgi:hypothetical protein
MVIDSKKYNGICSCGKAHEMTTESCFIEPGCLLNADKYIKECGLNGYCVAIYDEATDAHDPLFALNHMVVKKRGEAGVVGAGDVNNSVDRFLERCFKPKNLFDF